MTAARVLLVEDDVLIRRFVGMALEDLPIDLIQAASVAEARTALATAPVDLLLTDLMLPDGNGIELVEALRAGAPAAGVDGAALPCIVLSAGVSASLRERLAALQVFAILDKPVAIRTLIDGVEQALRRRAGAAAAPAAAAGASRAGEAAAIAAHFGGETGLFAAFKAASLPQLLLDAEAGDAACRAGDVPALRRLAHSLKTVLRLLGQDAAGARAGVLERAAAEAVGADELASQWRALRADLLALR